LYCNAFCFPYGYPFLTGLPAVYISAILSKILSLNVLITNTITSILFIVTGYIATISLLKRCKIDILTSIFITTIWLINPILWGHYGIPYLTETAILLPLFVLIDWILYEKITSGSKYKILAYYLLETGTKTFALFMFGYIFVMYNFVSFIILLVFIKKNKTNKKIILKELFLFIIPNLLAFLIYKLYIGIGTNYPADPVSLIRAMSTDIITLFVPSKNFWLIDKLGLSTNIKTLKLYGDGTNSNLNYIGLSIFTTVIISVIIFFKKNKTIKICTTIGLIALILSLGPTLKFNTKVDNQNNSITYKMSKDAGILDLHTDFIYNYIPGIKNMRATYRWIILFKLSLFICAGILLTQLLKNKRYGFYTFLVIIIFLEMMPNIPMLNEKNTTAIDQYSKFRDDIIQPLSKIINENDRIAFLSTENDYLANFIAAETKSHSYNCGGDKNMLIARKERPKAFDDMRKTDKNIDQNIKTLLDKKSINKFIIPFFNLRWDSYSWPPKTIKKDDIENYKIDSQNYKIKELEWAYVIQKSN